MDRPLVPEGVEITQQALQALTTAYTFHIQRRTVDACIPGRASGLQVSIGTPATRFTFAAGFGYTPRGDYVESGGALNIPLADPTAGVVNYACLAYQEVYSQPEAYEDGGSTKNTIASRSSTLFFLTQAQYQSLPASSGVSYADNLQNANLAVYAQDRIVVLAQVTGKGASTTYMTADLTNGTIIQSPLYSRILTASLTGSWSSLPSVGTYATTAVTSTTPNITGVNIKSLPANVLGTTVLTDYGVLQLSVPVFGTGATWVFSWAAPSSTTGPGATVSINASASPQVITLADGGDATKKITLEVVTNLLPILSSGTATYYDQVTVAGLYQIIDPVFSADDQQHRSYLGSYVPTAADPHGTGYPDFAQEVAVIPSPITAGTGYLASAFQAALARFGVATASTGRTGFFEVGTPSGCYTRAYYNAGNQSFEITTNAKWNANTFVWMPDQAAFNSVKYAFTPTATSQALDGLSGFQYSSSGASFADNLWTTQLPIGNSISLGSLLVGSIASASIPRIQANRATAATANRTALFEDNSSSGVCPIAIYLANSATVVGTPGLEFTFNALWNSTTSNWVAQIAGYAWYFCISESGIQIFYYNAAASASWSDTANYPSVNPSGWTQLSGINNSAAYYGAVIAGVGEQRLNQGTSDQTTARFASVVNPTSSGSGTRWLISSSSSGSMTYRKYFNQSGTQGWFEETINASWALTGNWVADAIGTAFLYSIQSDGIYQKQKAIASGGQTWLDNSWDATPFMSSNGNIQLSGAWNFGANTLCAANIMKAYGRFALSSSGTVITTKKSFNVQSLTVATVPSSSSLGIKVVYTDAMKDSNYLIYGTVNRQSSVTSGAKDLYADPSDITSTQAYLSLYNGATYIDPTSTPGQVDFNFYVWGEQ